MEGKGTQTECKKFQGEWAQFLQEISIYKKRVFDEVACFT